MATSSTDQLLIPGPGDEDSGDDGESTTTERFVLMAVRLLALPFLLIGIVLWAAVIGVGALAAGVRRMKGLRGAWATPHIPSDV